MARPDFACRSEAKAGKRGARQKKKRLAHESTKKVHTEYPDRLEYTEDPMLTQTSCSRCSANSVWFKKGYSSCASGGYTESLITFF